MPSVLSMLLVCFHRNTCLRVFCIAICSVSDLRHWREKPFNVLAGHVLPVDVVLHRTEQVGSNVKVSTGPACSPLATSPHS
jgi:hypothetical protein